MNDLIDSSNLKGYYLELSQKLIEYDRLIEKEQYTLQRVVFEYRRHILADEINNLRGLIQSHVDQIESHHNLYIENSEKEDDIEMHNLREVYMNTRSEFYNPQFFEHINVIVQKMLYLQNETENINQWMENISKVPSEHSDNFYNVKVGDLGNFLTIKTPSEKGRSLFHEYIVGKTLNKLRTNDLSHAFPYTYNLVTCSPITNDIKEVNKFCAKDDQNFDNHLILEYLNYKETLSQYLLSEDFKYSIFYSLLLNTFVSIGVANERVNYTNWNLKASNVLIRTVPVSYNEYKGKYINNREVFPCIIGHEDASIEINGEDYTYILKPTEGEIRENSSHFRSNPCPAADIYMLLITCYLRKWDFSTVNNLSMTNDHYKAFVFLRSLLFSFLGNNELDDIDNKKLDDDSIRDIIYRDVSNYNFTMTDFLNTRFKDADPRMMERTVFSELPKKGRLLTCSMDGLPCNNLYEDRFDDIYSLSFIKADLYGISDTQIIERYGIPEMVGALLEMDNAVKEGAYILSNKKSKIDLKSKNNDLLISQMLEVWDSLNRLKYFSQIMIKYALVFNYMQQNAGNQVNEIQTHLNSITSTTRRDFFHIINIEYVEKLLTKLYNISDDLVNNATREDKNLMETIDGTISLYQYMFNYLEESDNE